MGKTKKPRENQKPKKQPLLSPYIEKNTFHYRPLASTISLRKRLSQKYVRQFFSNFFL